MDIIHPITFQNGKVKLENPENYHLWVGQFKDGTEGELIVRKKKKSRTTGKHDELGNQNGYLWVIVYPISAKELGYTVQEMHEVFTAMFAPYVYKDFKGQKIAVKIRTSQMSTVQCAEYTESIRIKMAEIGCEIPNPERVI